MRRSILSQSVMFVALMLTVVAGAPFELVSERVSGGGGMRITGGGFSLSGTIGQPEAGGMSGGDFRLTGGFWFETPPGDCNGNGAVELLDFELFTACWMGPDASPDPECACFNVLADEAVDLADFAELQNNFAGV
jgi:hypothetical protein